MWYKFASCDNHFTDFNWSMYLLSSLHRTVLQLNRYTCFIWLESNIFLCAYVSSTKSIQILFPTTKYRVLIALSCKDHYFLICNGINSFRYSRLYRNEHCHNTNVHVDIVCIQQKRSFVYLSKMVTNI